ncbi:MAG: trehalase family glycosidase, partial [Candidatus Solibacter sp.]|nr:trehalase family glycosidase [Candidatus Solibacter sp.]
LEWSEVYTPSRRRPYITVSRTWARAGVNSSPDFLWDSFFNAVLVCQEDERKAYDMIRAITSWQNDQGMFAQYGAWEPAPQPSIFPVAWGHTQYPVGALALAKVYQRRPNRALLAEIYPRLLKNHRWWFADRGDGQPWRDGNRNGLLELGSNYPEEIPYASRQQVAYYESYDDSPQWWRVAKYNERTGTLEQDTVERNCLFAMDCWILSWLARQLGRLQEAAALEAEHLRMAATINRLLWNPRRQCYFNRHWDNHDGDRFFPHVSPDIFMSLLGKVATPEQAEALRKMFHDPAKFAGQWILPTISRDDPEYPKQHYWKGKVWAPVNWLVYQGFKIYDWDREAGLLAESSTRMFLKPWRERAECHENFLSTTGEGSSDPHYTWGALMALIGVEEYIDANPWHGLRFGNLHPSQPGSLERYFVAGSLYDVALAPDSMEVRRDGKLLFAADAPLEIRRVRFQDGRVHAEVRAAKAATLRVGGASPRAVPPGVTQI